MPKYETCMNFPKKYETCIVCCKKYFVQKMRRVAQQLHPLPSEKYKNNYKILFKNNLMVWDTQ